jgi:hypothetical protein
VRAGVVAVAGETFGRTLVTGCVYTVVDGLSAPAAGCDCAAAAVFCVFVCGAFATVAARTGLCAAGAGLCAAADGCLYTVAPAGAPL